MVTGLIPTALPGLIKLVQIYALALVGIDSYQNGLVGSVVNIVNSINSSGFRTKIQEYLTGKFKDVHSGTVAFLIAYDNFNKSTGKVAAAMRLLLLEYYKEEFIVGIEQALQKGVDIGTLIYYGVTDFFSPTVFEDVYNMDNSVVSFPPLVVSFLLQVAFSFQVLAF